MKDPYAPSQHSNMNPFSQAPVFNNSGPSSFIDFEQNENDYYGPTSYVEQAPPPPPKTPIRTPVMGTRTYQHRRTLSNASSQYSGRGGQVDYGEVINPAELDYRFNNFNISGAINREPLHFHSVPYSCNQPDNTNVNPVPDRMRLYENISHFQHNIHDSHSIALNSPQNQTPIKTTYIETTTHNQDAIKSTNSIRRELFFNSEANPVTQNCSDQCSTESRTENHPTNEMITSTLKISGSTGCTPTHSTPQDSFSDDSSYLSALSSQNRVRFSPDNFLADGNNAFSPTSRIAVANLQRAMVRRAMELEEGEKS